MYRASLSIYTYIIATFCGFQIRQVRVLYLRIRKVYGIVMNYSMRKVRTLYMQASIILQRSKNDLHRTRALLKINTISLLVLQFCIRKE